MIVTKDCYTITDLVLQTAPPNETERVWTTITLKDHSKLVVGSFYRPPNKGVSPILELESKLSEITDTFRNNPITTFTLGGYFNAEGIDWETGLVPDDSPNILLTGKTHRGYFRSRTSADAKGTNHGPEPTGSLLL